MSSLYLTVGDWTLNLRKEGVSAPLFASPFCPVLYTCGAFSPSRPAVIFVGRSDGFIDIWDLLDRTHEPSLTMEATPAAVSCRAPTHRQPIDPSRPQHCWSGDAARPRRDCDETLAPPLPM